MKKIIVLSILIFAYQSAISQTKGQIQKLDSIFTMLNLQDQFNGSVLIAEKGKIIYQKGFGFRNEKTLKKNNPNTVFEIASSSKQFTATAILLLNRNGKINYTDKITKFIPELDNWSDVTINHLLHHTSGIPEYLFDMQEEWDKSRIATNEDLINFYSNRKDTLQFPAGSKYQYCNTNYALLASIVERVTNEKFEDFLHHNIFKPLKMKNTFIYNRRLSPKKINNYAIGYYWKPNSFTKITADSTSHGDTRPYYLDGIVGNAKVNSTIRDLYKWINALKTNAFLTQKEFEKMTEITRTTKGDEIPYGFGLDLSKKNGNLSYGHTGRWDGYNSFIYHNQAKDRTIIVLQNFDMGTYPFRNINEILDKKPLSEEYKKKIKIPYSKIEKYAGVYTDEKGNKHLITFKEGFLIYNTEDIPWDMRFFPISKNIFQAIRIGGMDGVMKFTEKDDGIINLEMLQYGEIIGTGTKTTPNR